MIRTVLIALAALFLGAMPMPAMAQASSWLDAPGLPDGWMLRDLAGQGCAIAYMNGRDSFGYIRVHDGNNERVSAAFSPGEGWPQTGGTFPATFHVDGREIGTLSVNGMPEGLWSIHGPDRKWLDETAQHASFELRLTGVPGAAPRVVALPMAERRLAWELVKRC